ncbi:Translocation protein S62 [Scheffersomyces spartinae]|uniref:Translocation protein SEC62 n=1 Tax=Scheffersomyces spartinae TaxID=45513 RepID=A0A9P7V539_9ASCO|nr:Translocation protein S62 [Scheffersomyces spartinae]KAG7191526.1 Translocation protein S62 [Scheffersomyces spartinae]
MAESLAAVGGQGIPTLSEDQAARLNQMVIKTANYLHENKLLKARIGLLNNKDDVSFFRLKRFKRAMTSPEYLAKQVTEGMLPLQSDEDALRTLAVLIQKQMIIPVDKLHYQEIKKVKGWKPNRLKPTLRPTKSPRFDGDAYFAWVYNKPNPYMAIYGFLALAGVFTIILFPLWPRFMRLGVWYLSMGVLMLLGLFFAMAIVRLIIYLITLLTMSKAFWLFPNLFADCGVIESFQPTYGWEEPKKTKKSSKKSLSSKKSATAASTKSEPIDLVSAADTTSSNTNGTAAIKRRVVLEEVDE